MYSNNVIFLDTRVPSVPIAELEGHAGIINDICWSPNQPTLVASGSDDGQLLIWDVSSATQKSDSIKEFGPIKKFSSNSEVQQISWASDSVIAMSDRASVSLVDFQF